MPLLLLALMVVSIVLLAGARLKGKYSPPGRMVDVGGDGRRRRTTADGGPLTADIAGGDFPQCTLKAP